MHLAPRKDVVNQCLEFGRPIQTMHRQRDWAHRSKLISSDMSCFLFVFLLSLFVTLCIFLHLTVMHSSTFGKGWVGMSACPLVVLACESLHVSGAVNTQGFVWKFFMRYI